MFHDRENHLQRFQTYSSAFLSSLTIHLIYIHPALGQWRDIIQRAEENLHTKTLAFYHEQVQPLLHRHWGSSSHPGGLSSKQAAEKARQNLRQFTSYLDELDYELLQHLDNQNNAQAEDLNASMWALAKDSKNEAIAMRIITVVTLIFLPATFVSTFFSAGVLKSVDDFAAPNDSTANDVGSNTTTAQPRGITFPNMTGRITTDFAMLSLWGIISGAALAVTAIFTVAWFIQEQRRLRRRMDALERQWPEIYERIKAFS
ncbi:hypothetical protein DL771_004001 [Monosporascus sp. 5C6A]|nr:hypothetical protein DL771_004001 [Monosporascus sp. 5C6A]